MAAVASPYVIRPMTIADIPQVSEIEQESFPTMWPQTAYKRELQQNSMARYLVLAETPAAQTVTQGQSDDAGGLVAVVRGVRRLFGKESLTPLSEPLEHLS